MTLQLPWSPETHGNLQPSNFTVTRIVYPRNDPFLVDVQMHNLPQRTADLATLPLLEIVYPRKDPFLVDVQMHNLPQQTADPRKDPFLVDVHSVETSTT